MQSSFFGLINSVAMTAVDNSVLMQVLVVGFVALFLAIIIAAAMISSKIGKGNGSRQTVEPASNLTGVSFDKPALKSEAGGISGEVVAAISAAIFAMSEADGVNYEIRDIKPVGKAVPLTSGSRGYKRPVWAAAGIYENTRPF